MKTLHTNEDPETRTDSPCQVRAVGVSIPPDSHSSVLLGPKLNKLSGLRAKTGHS